MRAILTPDDLKKGEVVSQAGWYPVEIIDYTEKEASTDKSTNSFFHFKILDAPNASDKGKIAQKMFNEKALGFGKNLYKTLGFPLVNGGYELSTELFRQTIGSKLMVYIKIGKSDKSNEFNDVADFKPMA